MLTTSTAPDSFTERAQAYLASALQRPGLTITDVQQPVGGGSRVTRVVTVEWSTPDDDSPRQERLVFRQERPGSIIESARELEFEMYRVFSQAGTIPVPRPLLLENDPQPLGTPFALMEWKPGIAAKDGLLRPEFASSKLAIGRQMFAILGTISGTPLEDLDFRVVSRVPMGWRRQLDHWSTIMEAHALGPMPVFSAAMRELRRTPPPAAPVRVVHGDFRIGNYLYTAETGIEGVVDWELAHIGDPYEDLAYACLRYWRPLAQQDLIAGAIPAGEAIAIWEKHSGLAADPDALRWWSIYAYLRLAAILATGAYHIANGSTTDGRQTATGMTEVPRFQLLAAELMGVLDR
jgi:aminoglycoside phosphotransferase (APT) family kinase protein